MDPGQAVEFEAVQFLGLNFYWWRRSGFHEQKQRKQTGTERFTENVGALVGWIRSGEDDGGTSGSVPEGSERELEPVDAEDYGHARGNGGEAGAEPLSDYPPGHKPRDLWIGGSARRSERDI